MKIIDKIKNSKVVKIILLSSSLIVAIGILSNPVSTGINKIYSFFKAQTKITQMEKDLLYIKASKGILKANMQRIEGNFWVYLSEKRTKAELYIAKSDDIYIYIKDGKAEWYICGTNKTQDKFTYTDFDGIYRYIEGTYTLENIISLLNNKN